MLQCFQVMLVFSSFCFFFVCFLLCFFVGFPENGHKKKRGAAEAFKREIWHQHRPSKVEKSPPSKFFLYGRRFRATVRKSESQNSKEDFVILTFSQIFWKSSEF